MSLNFAGRWTGEIFYTPEQLKKLSNKEEVDLSENPNHLRFSDDPALADEVIARFLGYRMDEIANIKETLATDYAGFDLFAHTHDPHKEVDFKAEGIPLYYIKKLTSLYAGDWIAETSVYDIEYWSADLTHFFQRVAKNPERQFLIPVDFHH